MYNPYNLELQKNSGMNSKFDDEMISIKGRSPEHQRGSPEHSPPGCGF